MPDKTSTINDQNALLDIRAAADFLNVSATSLRRWTNAGVLPCLRLGQRRERRFRRGDLEAFMEHSHDTFRSASAKGKSLNLRETRPEPVTVTLGNHLLGIYASDIGRVSLSVPFLLEGLREGSVCLLIAPPRSQKQIAKTLGELHPSLPDDIKKGRLIFLMYEKSARAAWKSVDTLLRKAQAAGASTFRVVGDVTAMRSLVSPRELVHYETGFDEKIVARFPVGVLCLYDARKFSGLELLNALKVHPDALRNPLGRSLA
jgi:transcriptional repressor of dcmA and dcmR